LVVVPESAPAGVVDLDGGRVGDGDEEEYDEVIVKRGAVAVRSRQIISIARVEDDDGEGRRAKTAKGVLDE
jgi:hypothetical protein